jgi:hypothetical protein
MPSRLEDTAHVVLAAIQQHFTDLGSSFKAMISVQMREPALEAYLRTIFHDPHKGKDEKHYKRALAQTQRNRAESARLFTEGKGNNLSRVSGSLWAAYNGVTEYIDFHRGQAEDTKWLENIWFGGGSSITGRALDEALRIVRPN